MYNNNKVYTFYDGNMYIHKKNVTIELLRKK